MKKSTVLVMSVLACACMAAIADQASDGIERLVPTEAPDAVAEPTAAVDESPSRWFVELGGPAVTEGGSAAAIASEKAAFRAAARAAKVRFVENYAYDDLFNGFSVTVSRVQLSTLARLPGVKAVYPVEVMSLPEQPVDVAEMTSALSMTGADIAQSSLGLDGSGIRVAVMDTGIDIDHPDFGGSGTDDATPFPSARIVAGYDFVGDAFNADPGSPLYNPVATPDANPDDCGGHGTHVAGIVGANGRIKGVAPNVALGAYRVFGCNGSTTADVMIAAMERARADGMQVLNMSIGSSFQWPQYPTAKAASNLVRQGMVVVASAGNSGTSGLYASGAPSVGDKVISVASFDNVGATRRAFTVSPDDRPVGYAPAAGSLPAPIAGTGTLQATGSVTSTTDACGALPAGSLSGRIALVRRGGCTFYAKAVNARTAGASAVVLYDNVAGLLTPNVTPPSPSDPAVGVPVVGVTRADGELMAARLAAGPVVLTWTDGFTSVPNPAGGLLSSFSSYGMSPDLQLKPDIGGPGGGIFSTYPLERGPYATLSGTSMSSPHVAGAVALLLQAAPRTPAPAVRGILQSTASPRPWSGNPTLGTLDVVHRQGAGMLRIDQAILATTRVEPDKLSLGESEAGPATRTLSLSNSGASTVTYTFSSVAATSTGPSSFAPSFWLPGTVASFSVPSVTLLPGQSASVQVTVTPPVTATNVGGMYGGYLVLQPDDGSPTLRVPFGGYVGDYQARAVLTPGGSAGFPWLARLVPASGGYSKVGAGAVYTMSGNDVPVLAIHFDHQARRMRVEIVDAVSGKSWHTAIRQEYLPRNSSTGFYAFAWDGVTTEGRKEYVVPNGRYVAKVAVLKALGDDANPAHWETWSTPEFRISR